MPGGSRDRFRFHALLQTDLWIGSKALKNLTSKLQSVGSATSEPQEESPVDTPEMVFKAYVTYDVGLPLTTMYHDQIITPSPTTHSEYSQSSGIGYVPLLLQT